MRGVVFERVTRQPVHENREAFAVALQPVDKAIELGGKCEGAPGLRGPQEMNYYAAYFRDLDGNKLTVTRQGVD